MRRTAAAETTADTTQNDDQADFEDNPVICARYVVDSAEQTLREVAKTHGVSAERVRQIERAALDKLGEAVCAA